MSGFGLPEAQLYCGEGGGQELHRAFGAGRVGLPGGGVSAVVGFDLANCREQFPGDAEFGARLLVEGEVVGRDVGEGGGARFGDLDAA